MAVADKKKTSEEAPVEITLEELTERLERLRLALIGGHHDGTPIVGLNTQLSSLSERVEELETLAVRLDVSPPAVPEVLYAGLRPADLFLKIFDVTLKAYFATYPTLLQEGRGNLNRVAHYASCVKVAMSVFETALANMPKLRA